MSHRSKVKNNVSQYMKGQNNVSHLQVLMHTSMPSRDDSAPQTMTKTGPTINYRYGPIAMLFENSQ